MLQIDLVCYHNSLQRHKLWSCDYFFHCKQTISQIQNCKIFFDYLRWKEKKSFWYSCTGNTWMKGFELIHGYLRITSTVYTFLGIWLLIIIAVFHMVLYIKYFLNFCHQSYFYIYHSHTCLDFNRLLCSTLVIIDFSFIFMHLFFLIPDNHHCRFFFHLSEGKELKKYWEYRKTFILPVRVIISRDY